MSVGMPTSGMWTFLIIAAFACWIGNFITMGLESGEPKLPSLGDGSAELLLIRGIIGCLFIPAPVVNVTGYWLAALPTAKAAW